MSKPVYWITLEQWMALTPAAHQRLNEHIERRGAELGIDVAGWHTDEIRAQDDFQKDKNEGRERFGGPGA